MFRKDWRSSNTYARLTDSMSGYGTSTPLRFDSSNISSGSSVPSMGRCSWAFGSLDQSISITSREGLGIGNPLDGPLDQSVRFRRRVEDLIVVGEPEVPEVEQQLVPV